MCLGDSRQKSVEDVTSRTTCRWARSSSAASLKEVCLASTRPRPQVGEYVLVHVGFAISRIDEDEAQEIFSYLEEIGEAMQEDGP